MNAIVKKTADDIVPEGKKFSHAEWRAYEAHKRSRAAGKEGILSASVIAQMFEVFLQGKSPTDISREWKGYQLGQIVAGAVENDWHGRKKEYLDHLHDNVFERVKQSAAEGTNFLMDLMAVAHRKWGPKLRRYLATGDEKELDGFEIRSIEQYRKVIQTFLELTGSKPTDFLKALDEKSKGAPGVLGAGGFDFAALISNRKLDPETAAALLKLISAPEKDEKLVETVDVK